MKIRKKFPLLIFTAWLALQVSCVSTTHIIQSPNFEKIDASGTFILFVNNPFSVVENEKLYENTLAPIFKNRIKVIYAPQAEWELRATGFMHGNEATYIYLTSKGNYYFIYLNLFDVEDPDNVDYQTFNYPNSQQQNDLSKKLKIKVNVYCLRTKKFIYTGIATGSASSFGHTRDNGDDIIINPYTITGLYKRTVKKGTAAMLKHCGL